MRRRTAPPKTGVEQKGKPDTRLLSLVKPLKPFVQKPLHRRRARAYPIVEEKHLKDALKFADKAALRHEPQPKKDLAPVQHLVPSKEAEEEREPKALSPRWTAEME